ncbi:oxidoreductase [Dacryopinax primogenitus]|uniref:3-dehydrosphinganine reductase n=1 Tax=Dacryopinax primogenitus (strain DJM 731) TaxID=1858805 RepID=M5GAV0_DACPD|nr:oxidoreductase [Dacryopinax primogenitus]EJU06024.1 oxidoreductase [Dacryopinax primogenitus]
MGQKWTPKGKHCYLTGASQGLGLCAALQLVKDGANVSIVARDQGKLDVALKKMEAARVSPSQKLAAYSHDISTAAGAQAALEAVCTPFAGQAPDAVFLCAGNARPLYFVEAKEEDFKSQIGTLYFTALWSAWAVAKLMVCQKVKGKIVFVSSTLGLMSFVGYAPYAPMKFAIRGLADTLRSEFQLYGISVHIYFPAGMFTPGYEEENKVKPAITKKIEEQDKACQPEEAAAVLIKGVKNGTYSIAGDFNTMVFRATTQSSSPFGNIFVKFAFEVIGWFGVPIWRWGVDADVRKYAPEHEAYLKQKGFFENEGK